MGLKRTLSIGIFFTIGFSSNSEVFKKDRNWNEYKPMPINEPIPCSKEYNSNSKTIAGPSPEDRSAF